MTNNSLNLNNKAIAQHGMMFKKQAKQSRDSPKMAV